jgi:DNA-damage-inducible protein D
MADLEASQPRITAFEQIKHVDEDQQEWWSARELYEKLDYKSWQDFYHVLQEAMTVYKQSGGADVDTIFKKTTRETTRRNSKKYTTIDYHLTRHACYLTVLSADGSKPIISLAKSYFAVRTRLHEIAQTEEDALRLERRETLRAQHRGLAWQAQQAGINNTNQFSRFWNFGYMGLYKRTASQIRELKGISSKQDIADYASSSELAHLIIKASLARDMMVVRHVSDPETAYQTHYEAGDRVRTMLIQAGVPTPELLPVPQKSYKQLLQEQIERERIAAENKEGLWGLIQEGAIQEEDEVEANVPLEFGFKITLTDRHNDTEIEIETLTEEIQGRESTVLSIPQPVNTLITIYWSPSEPTDAELKEEVMLALSEHLGKMISQDERLKELYKNLPPL